MIRFLSLLLLASLCSGYELETQGTFNCTGTYSLTESIKLTGDLTIAGPSSARHTATPLCKFEHSSKFSAFVLNGHKLRLEGVYVTTSMHKVTSGTFVDGCDHWMNPNRVNEQSLRIMKMGHVYDLKYMLRPPLDVQLMEKNHAGLCGHYSKLAEDVSVGTESIPGKDSDFPHGCSYEPSQGNVYYGVDSVQTLKVVQQGGACVNTPEGVCYKEIYHRPSCSASKPCVCMGAAVDNIESGGTLELVDSHINEAVDIVGENLIMTNTYIGFLNHDNNYDAIGKDNVIGDSYNYGYCSDTKANVNVPGFVNCHPACGQVFEYCPRTDSTQALPNFRTDISVYGDVQNYNRWRLEKNLNSHIDSKWTYYGPNTCDSKISSGACVQDGNYMLMGSCLEDQYVDESICKPCPFGSTAVAPQIADVNSECKSGLSTCENGLGIQRYSIMKRDDTVTHFKVSQNENPITLTYNGEDTSVTCDATALVVQDALSRLSTTSGKEIHVWNGADGQGDTAKTICDNTIFISGLDAIVTVTTTDVNDLVINQYAEHGLTGVVEAPLYPLDHSCASCDAYYHLEGNRCVENVCTCSVGDYAATGTDCPTHGSAKCMTPANGGELNCGGNTIDLTSSIIMTGDLTVKNCHFVHDSDTTAFKTQHHVLTLIDSTIKTTIKRITSGANTCNMATSTRLDTDIYHQWCGHLAQKTDNGGQGDSFLDNIGVRYGWNQFPYGCFGYYEVVHMNRNQYSSIECNYGSDNNACICLQGRAIHGDPSGQVLLRNTNVDGVINLRGATLKMEDSEVLLILDEFAAAHLPNQVDAKNSRLMLKTEVTPKTCATTTLTCPNCVDTEFGIACADSCAEDQRPATTGGGFQLIDHYTDGDDSKFNPNLSGAWNGKLYARMYNPSSPWWTMEILPGGNTVATDCSFIGYYGDYAWCQDWGKNFYKIDKQGTQSAVSGSTNIGRTIMYNKPAVGINSNGKLAVRYFDSNKIYEFDLETLNAPYLFKSWTPASGNDFKYIRYIDKFWYFMRKSFTDDMDSRQKFTLPQGGTDTPTFGTVGEWDVVVLHDYFVFGNVENGELCLHEYHPTTNAWKYYTHRVRSNSKRGWIDINRAWDSTNSAWVTSAGGNLISDGKELFLNDGYSFYKSLPTCESCPNGLVRSSGDNPFTGETECGTKRVYTGQTSGNYELHEDLEIPNGRLVNGDLTITGIPDAQGNKPAITVPAATWVNQHPGNPYGTPYPLSSFGYYNPYTWKNIFSVLSGRTLTLVNVTLQGASAKAILNYRGATFHCTDCEIKNSYVGGAIYNSGTMHLTNSLFQGNSWVSWSGHISWVQTGNHPPIYHTEKRYEDESKGGAIYNEGSAYVTSCTFTGNKANYGADIFSKPSGYLEIRDSTFDSPVTSDTVSDRGDNVYGIEAHGRADIQYSYLRDGYKQGLWQISTATLSNNVMKGPIYKVGLPLIIKDSTVEDAQIEAEKLDLQDTSLDNSPITVHHELKLLRANLTNVATAVTVKSTAGKLEVIDSTIDATNSIVSDGTIGTVTLDPDLNCDIHATKVTDGLGSQAGWKCPTNLNDLSVSTLCPSSVMTDPDKVHHSQYASILSAFNNKRDQNCYDYGSNCAVCQGCIVEQFTSTITGSTITPAPVLIVGDDFGVGPSDGQPTCMSQNTITPVLEAISNRKSGLRNLLASMNKAKLMIARENLDFAGVFRSATKRVRVLKQNTESTVSLNSDESVYVPLETGEQANVTLSNYDLEVKLEQTSGGLKVTVAGETQTLQSGEGVIHGKIKIVAD
jgi:hypothetical protein